MTKMESVKSVSTTVPAEQLQDMNKTESAENFKKCIYELFHKNGVLNDLRAYLRGHIVNVLKSSRAGEGELPLCQKRFSQRLEPKFQALNMLIAEYLLCMEFSYSFSVFIAEIPLANMVFDFAKTLMDVGPDGEAFGLRFKDREVWSIMNYLGVQCDSEQANNVVEMYKNNNELSLLFCIMRCVQLCANEPNYPVFSRDASSSSCKTSEAEPCSSHTQATKSRKQCSHSAICKTCRSHFSHLQDKYAKKKKQFAKNSKENIDPLVVEAFMKKVGFLERKLMDETLEHVSSVYELEVNMVKSEQEESIKRSLASHAIQFKEKQTELEESFKARSAALAGSLDRKKRFLWGLARSLRAQHAHMARAMCAVRAHAERLAQKEQNIKLQLRNAEETLKRRCEEMHKQITGELSNLEEHIESIKSERDVLHRERSEFDDFKKDSENKSDSSDLRSHYDLLKTELITLKSYFENSLQKSRCFLERSTITDLSGVNSKITVMNNEADRTVLKEEARPTQVVNNLKKTKNINFGQQSGSELASSDSREPSLAHLLRDNERLRLLADQQAAQLAEMAAHAARLQAALHRRPRTAPQCSMVASASSNSFGWCKGAGEELCFSLGRPRVLLPGDAVPFVGVVAERRAARWHLINQLRGARRRSSPNTSKTAAGQWPAHRVSSKEHNNGHVISVSSPPSTHCGADAARASRGSREVRVNLTTVTESKKPREKSPSSVLREAKERLRTDKFSICIQKVPFGEVELMMKTMDGQRNCVPRAPRAAPPHGASGALREAKLRLRKLEIEAEAVEHSYRAFRRRQRPGYDYDDNLPQSDDEIEEDIALEQTAGHSKSVKECNDLLKVNLEKYLTKYQHEYDIGQLHFRNKNTVNEIKKPIPTAFSENVENTAKPPTRDFLNIPLVEFRNLYCPRSEGRPGKSGTVSKEQPEGEPELMSNSEQIKAAKENLTEVLKYRYNKQQLELKELKKQQNMNKIYNLQDVPTKEVEKHKERKEEADDKNLLRVEVESEAHGLSEQSLTLTVESCVEPGGARCGSRLDSASTVAAPTMTIVVSPKRAAREPTLTRHDVLKAIYNARDKLRAGRERAPDSGEDSAGQDSFSADVDNYAAGDDERAPLSPPKTNDEEVSWG